MPLVVSVVGLTASSVEIGRLSSVLAAGRITGPFIAVLVGAVSKMTAIRVDLQDRGREIARG